MLSTEATRTASPSSEGTRRDPNRRPLLVDKVMFARMQATQRLASQQPHFPNIDLACFGTAALRIVFAMPNADQLIIKQTLQDLLNGTDSLRGADQAS